MGKIGKLLDGNFVIKNNVYFVAHSVPFIYFKDKPLISVEEFIAKAMDITFASMEKKQRITKKGGII